jgi:chromosome segregation ATPase
MELEGTLPYKGYNIVVRNGAFGGINATVFSASGQVLATLRGDFREEATRRAKTWIDNQDESDAELFLGSLAERDQDVVRLEARIEDLEESKADLVKQSESQLARIAELTQQLENQTAHLATALDMIGKLEENSVDLHARITELEAENERLVSALQGMKPYSRSVYDDLAGLVTHGSQHTAWKTCLITPRNKAYSLHMDIKRALGEDTPQ